MDRPAIKLSTQKLNVYYGDFHALKDIDLAIDERRITALIGPSGCGKTTLLRVFNRMFDFTPSCRVEGVVELDGRSILAPGVDLETLRRQVGMVFQRPNPFPLSIYENVAYGPRIHALARGRALDVVVRRCLDAVGLWGDLEQRLDDDALTLTAEQQQRLCIARAIAVEPEVLLMDEPCSVLDPIATLHIEGLMRQLARQYTIVIVTHNMQQAARISQTTGFVLRGELVELRPTAELFTSPRDPRTEDYVTGRFG